MCIVCVEIMKGKLTWSEAKRNYRETNAPHTEREIEEIETYIVRERPDLVQGYAWDPSPLPIDRSVK